MFPGDTAFTVFDIETTGLSPRGGDRIVEIAGVRVEGGTAREDLAFVSTVNPERPVPWEAKAVHRIPKEELQRAPLIETVLPQFLAFAEGSILVAHNAEFELEFLSREKEMCWGYVDIPECLCTLCLSRSVQPQEYRHDLETAAVRLGLSAPPMRHRALPDVLLTAGVLLKLIAIGNIRSLAELRERASPPSAGKARHVGKKARGGLQRMSVWR